MGVGTRPTDPVEIEAALLDEAAGTCHGRLTVTLVGLLERQNTATATFADLVAPIERQEFSARVDVRIPDEARRRPVWATAAHLALLQETLALERAPLRRIIATLNAAIARRQGVDDFWPEGRLNAGIACAAAGDYKEANQLIGAAEDILHGWHPAAESDRAA